MSIRKITEEEVRSLWVQRLSDTPNRGGRFGSAGLTAAEMKAAYDALPLRIVSHFNELVELILDGGLDELIPAGDERTLADFFREVTSGELAEYLTVDGVRSLSALAAALDTHRHEGEYAPLGEDGKVPAANLPTLVGADYEEAEKERRLAESERRAEEERRRATHAAMTAALAALEELRDEVAIKVDGFSTRLTAGEEAAEDALRAATEAKRTAELLSAATLGATHSFLEKSYTARSFHPPAGALPYARILRLGGASSEGYAKTTAVLSEGASVLPYPYPAARKSSTRNGVSVLVGDDGSITLNGTASESFSFSLYRETHSLALPKELLYIDTMTEGRVVLYVRTGSSGDVWRTGFFTPSESDEYYGHYLAYLYISAGQTFNHERILPTITRGGKIRSGVLYRPPYRFEIPPEVQALPAYGRAGNYLDFVNNCYRQRYDEFGTSLTAEVLHPLPEGLADEAWIPIEEDGTVTLENDQDRPVAAAFHFGVRLL